MPLPTWPAVNNRPTRNGFQPIKRFLEPISTDMEGGNTRERPRPGDNVGTITQTINMKMAEHDIFVPWVKNTLNNGTARFIADVWLGSGYLTKVCKFAKGGKPTYAPISANYVAVTMTILVFDV